MQICKRQRFERLQIKQNEGASLKYTGFVIKIKIEEDTFQKKEKN